MARTVTGKKGRERKAMDSRAKGKRGRDNRGRATAKENRLAARAAPVRTVSRRIRKALPRGNQAAASLARRAVANSKAASLRVRVLRTSRRLRDRATVATTRAEAEVADSMAGRDSINARR